jgi:hypothetical protein
MKMCAFFWFLLHWYITMHGSKKRRILYTHIIGQTGWEIQVRLQPDFKHCRVVCRTVWWQ